MHEIIYILINEAMPGYVKIGRTTDLNQRLRSLYRTQVPLPFEVFYACIVEKATDAGKDASEKIQGAAKKSVEKAADSIKKFLPFGNKEKK